MFAGNSIIRSIACLFPEHRGIIAAMTVRFAGSVRSRHALAVHSAPRHYHGRSAVHGGAATPMSGAQER
jgi:hypothetical protein